MIAMIQRAETLYKNDINTERRAFSKLLPTMLQGDVSLGVAYKILSGIRKDDSASAKLLHDDAKRLLYGWHRRKYLTIINGMIRLNYNHQLLQWLDSDQIGQLLRLADNPWLIARNTNRMRI